MHGLEMPTVQHATRRFTSVDLVTACLARLRDTRRSLNAFVTEVDADAALDAARASDVRRAAGQALPGRLDGIPVSVKDNFCTVGLRTSASSRMLADFVPPYDAAAVERLRAAGAIIVGKTNMDEFGMGSASSFSHFGPVRNPWETGRSCVDDDGAGTGNGKGDSNGKGDDDDEATGRRSSRRIKKSWALTPGGSSGGSAAAVAAGSCFGSLGSDTGGSVRQPAACCGVRRMAPCEGVRVGVPLDFDVAELGPGMRREWDAAAKALSEAGAEVVPVGKGALDAVRSALPAYYTIALAEASSNLARYDGARYGHRSSGVMSNTNGGSGDDDDEEETTSDSGSGGTDARSSGDALHSMYTLSRSEGFGAEVQRRVLLGTYVLSAAQYDSYYGSAARVRDALRGQFEAVYRKPANPPGTGSDGEKGEQGEGAGGGGGGGGAGAAGGGGGGGGEGAGGEGGSSSGVDVLLTPTTLTTAADDVVDAAAATCAVGGGGGDAAAAGRSGGSGQASEDGGGEAEASSSSYRLPPAGLQLVGAPGGQLRGGLTEAMVRCAAALEAASQHDPLS
eukprot:g5680.t1